MSEPIVVPVPAFTANDDTVRLVAWEVRDGEHVQEQQTLASVETSKAVLEIVTPAAGFVWLNAQIGDDCAVGMPLVFITDTPVRPRQATAREPAAVAIAASGAAVHLSAGAAADGDAVLSRLSPFARQLASAIAIEEPVRTVSDVVAPSEPAVRGNGPAVRWEPLSKAKLAECRQLRRGAAATLSTSVMCRFPFGAFRKSMASRRAQVSATGLLLHHVARLLGDFPVFNAVYDADRIGYFDTVTLGWAVGDERALTVLAVADANRKTAAEIDGELSRTLAAYAQGRLQAKDMTAVTFTVSDLSEQGAAAFVPLIAAGQGAILGVGAELVTLTFDHQLADGRAAARFLDALVARLGAAAPPPADDDAPPAFCVRCQRDSADLAAAQLFLLACAGPERQHVCSACLIGY